ncbi:MAG: TlpA disulfide reductase family protein [Bacteroidota bacterium]|nr:TlpA disulfide reductase family protein [Bacteroidota bacterium]
MKKILILSIFSVVFLTTCSNSKTNDEATSNTEGNDSTLTVKGNFTPAAGTSIYFEKLSPDKLIRLDSATIGETGTFNFSHNPDKVDIYRIRIGKRGIFLIAQPGETITLTADKKPITKHYNITGSEESKLAMEMHKHLTQAAEQMQALGNEYRAAKDKTKAEQQQILTRINKEAETIMNNSKTKLNTMIKNNKESIFIYLALFQQLGQNMIFSFPKDEDTFDFVLKNMQEYNPDVAYTKKLKSDINKMRMQAEQKQSQQGGFGVGDVAPNITLNTPDGETKSLYDLKGNYVLLDFWAGWCRPCRMENPNIVSTYNKYKSDNFTIFQVSLDKKKADWVKAIEKDNLSQWHHVSDLKYWNSEAAAQYSVRGIPANFLLNPEGKIIATNLRGPALGKKLEDIFGH